MSRRATPPEVVAARVAVERCLDDLAAGQSVLVACSGGPDSLALAGAAAWVAGRRSLHISAVVVDHGLQPASAAIAAAAATACRALGVDEVVVVEAAVGRDGGPEAAARAARYAAIEYEADRRGAVAVLLGHTRDDQAETVLLRLARGSGARSLAAMPRRRDQIRRPFLDLPRSVVHASAEALLAPHGLSSWSDPHNADPSFARARIRAAMGEIQSSLGPGAVLGLARSADLLRDDADALDAWADGGFTRVVRVVDGHVEADCDALAELPRAVRSRVVRLMCIAAGCAAEDLGIDHVRAVDALVGDWHGQGPVALPSGVSAERACGRLCLRVSPPTGALSGA